MPPQRNRARNPYRDDVGARRIRLRLLERDVARLERAIPASVLPYLPVELRTALERSAQAEAARLDSSRRALLLGSRLVALERVLAHLPELRRRLTRPPEPSPDRMPAHPRIFLLPAAREECRADVERLRESVRAVDARAVVWTALSMNFWDIHAALQVEGEPFDLRQRCIALVGFCYVNHLAVSTPVAPAMPALTVEPEGLRHRLLYRPLGLRSRPRLGHAGFDRRFVVEGHPLDAKALLSPAVRAGLLAIAHDRPPRLRVGGGRAEVCWEHPPTARAVRAAVRVLAELRRVPLRPLLRRKGLWGS